MQSNSRATALEINGKEKEMVHQKKWSSFQLVLILKFWRVSDDRIVAGSLFHARRLQICKQDVYNIGAGLAVGAASLNIVSVL